MIFLIVHGLHVHITELEFLIQDEVLGGRLEQYTEIQVQLLLAVDSAGFPSSAEFSTQSSCFQHTSQQVSIMECE